METQKMEFAGMLKDYQLWLQKLQSDAELFKNYRENTFVNAIRPALSEQLKTIEQETQQLIRLFARVILKAGSHNLKITTQLLSVHTQIRSVFCFHYQHVEELLSEMEEVLI
ncbi:hypothetical protein SAMN04515674_10124 [Pseudarcicella hirudinis]|uniref:Uncharacterized protein n=1 Tax=Pseudarcicella hirudinis TaxID=1079859 RepID=A0A1I5LYG6_9BACT|nr:hypothetical protein [Pseudarcicella hirudinis]SFP02369.1 hypothetical protein SAMN04515674_10124 [Pseudarcicella hirudinis]